MCLQVINCNFTQASNNEELLLDEGCCSPTASHLPVFFSLFDSVISLHSGFSIVHQYIQHFNEVSGNNSGKIPPCVWEQRAFHLFISCLNMRRSVTGTLQHEHFQPNAGYYGAFWLVLCWCSSVTVMNPSVSAHLLVPGLDALCKIQKATKNKHCRAYTYSMSHPNPLFIHSSGLWISQLKACSTPV